MGASKKSCICFSQVLIGCGTLITQVHFKLNTQLGFREIIVDKQYCISFGVQLSDSAFIYL